MNGRPLEEPQKDYNLSSLMKTSLESTINFKIQLLILPISVVAVKNKIYYTPGDNSDMVDD